MKKLLLILFSVIMMFHLSCEKSSDKPPNGGTDERPDEIIVGDENGMKINTVDTIIIGDYNHPNGLNIDVDMDGTYDIRLEAEFWGSPQVGDHPTSRILALDSTVQLLGNILTDSIFVFVDTVFHQEKEYYFLHKNYYHSCFKNSNSDSIYRVYTDQLKVTSLDEKSIVRNSDAFKSDTTTLINDSYSYRFNSYYLFDTIWVWENRVFKLDCNTFPLQQVKFIGYRIIEQQNSRLGWIKLELLKKDKIKIYKTAIQE